MSRNDVVALILSYLYAFGLLFLMETLGKRLSWPTYVTRKLIHICAGMCVWGVVLLFDHCVIGIIPFATFIFLNYLFYKKQSFSKMDDPDSTPGTVYFALSITLLFMLFWRNRPAVDYLPIAMASSMAMTWGDAMAALVGKSFGRRTFSVHQHIKSVEGTAAFLLFSFISVFLTLFCAHLYSEAGFSLQKSLLLAGVVSPAAAAAEALSPRGTDNLTVPLVAALILYLLY